MGENRKNILAKIVIYIVLLLFILTLTLTVTINFTPLFKLSLKYNDLETTSGFSNQIIYKNFKQLMKYLNNPFANHLEMDDFASSESGEFHFFEVKKLFLLNYIICIISICILIITYFVFSKKKKIKMRDFKIPLIITGIIPFFVILFIFLDFDTVFLKFHQILFSNDKWLFNPNTDPIINVLPQQFFLYCFVFALVLFEVLVIGIIIFGERQKKL